MSKVRTKSATLRVEGTEDTKGTRKIADNARAPVPAKSGEKKMTVLTKSLVKRHWGP